MAKGEVKTGALPKHALGPYFSAMPFDDVLDDDQAYPSTRKLGFGVKPLKQFEHFVGILHIKAHPIVAHEIDYLAFG